VLAALVDFTERRPELWTAIDPAVYEVHTVGDRTADVTEGSDVLGGIWAREHYEWDGATVRATIVASNLWLPGGTWQATVTADHAGGSRIEVVRDRQARNVRGRVLEALLRLVGRRMLAAELARAPAVAGAGVAPS
jgi:hypothetical protein